MIFLVTTDSTTVDNYDSTLGTGPNGLENYTGVNINLYSGQVEGTLGLFANFIDTDNITANTSCSNCDHESCVEDQLLSNYDHKSLVEDGLLFNCDTKECVEDEMNSYYDTCLVEDESVRLSGMNSISLNFVNHAHACQPVSLENDL